MQLRKPLKKSDIKVILLELMLDFSKCLVKVLLDELEQKLSRFARRRYPRLRCSLPVEYTAGGRRYEGRISNISRGGAFVDGGDILPQGQENSVRLIVSGAGKPVSINGRVIRTTPRGVGVKFRTEIRLEQKLRSCGPTSEREETADTIKEEKEMARFRKRRIRWTASTAPDVTGYKLYWALGGGVNYDSDFAEVGQVTEVILPDDVLAFPLVEGDIELGLTAVNHAGNESDMTKFSAHFDFTAPEAPTDLVVETI